MEMSNLVGKIKALKLEITDDFLVHLVFLSLPIQFKVGYNTQKEKRTLNELISQCVQEEDMMQRDKTKNSQNKRKNKAKDAAGTHLQKKVKKGDELTCFFYKKAGHVKKDCPKYVTWPVKKVEFYFYFLFGQKWLFCGFGNKKLSISLDSNVIGTGILVDCLYMLEVIASHNEILHANSKGTKRKLNENSASLWHKRLGHISKQRIHRLVSDEILDSLDLTDYEVCVECVKGKLTNTRKLSANGSADVLELIHMDICGPFSTAAWNDQQYFITFIDDYSRYGYLYLIREKSQSLDVFRSYKAEVELQLGKKIKAVTSDCGGEYDMTDQVSNVQDPLLTS
ncbi:hypothetical protein V2J09_006745 [Rumex salicifolius]